MLIAQREVFYNYLTEKKDKAQFFIYFKTHTYVYICTYVYIYVYIYNHINIKFHGPLVISLDHT